MGEAVLSQIPIANLMSACNKLAVFSPLNLDLDTAAKTKSKLFFSLIEENLDDLNSNFDPPDRSLG